MDARERKARTLQYRGFGKERGGTYTSWIWGGKMDESGSGLLDGKARKIWSFVFQIMGRDGDTQCKRTHPQSSDNDGNMMAYFSQKETPKG